MNEKQPMSKGKPLKDLQKSWKTIAQEKNDKKIPLKI